MAQVLNYHDAVVYDSDIALFRDGSWLNDNCINWYFRLLEHDVFPENRDILFMDPAVVSCMMNQCDEPDELLDLGRGIDVASRTLVFVPVNDSADRLSLGSHWSLLVFARNKREDGGFSFRHYDSSAGSNRGPAEKTATQFVKMFDGMTEEPMVEQVSDCPQQRNGYDCGMYTILLAERLASDAIVSGSSISRGDIEGERGSGVASVPLISPEFVSEARSFARERLYRCIRDYTNRDLI